MPTWKPIVGLSFKADQFDSYCHSLQWTAWRPSFIALHNTATPNLAQRPNGFTQQHMLNFVSFFRDEKHWSAGPHLFIDDKKIWVFTPLTMSGVHSPSWNKLAIGIEMLGNYASDSFKTGRGLAVRQNAVAAMATLCAVLGLDPATIRLHKEDTATTHDCPGKNVKKSEVIAEVQALIHTRHGGGHVIV
jgi:N-acetylmuramoyl-L-alanine amidase CwlA